MKLIIDDREMRSLVPGFIQIQYEKERLDIGDYVITNDEVSVCIERKTASDYIGSMQNGRLNNQLYNMSTNYDQSFVIVEGSVQHELMYRSRNVKGTVASIAGSVLKRSPDGKSGGVNIVFSENPFWTAELIMAIYKKLETEEYGFKRTYAPERRKMNTDERIISIIASFPGVGPKRSKDILEKFGSLWDIACTDKSELLKVKGIGNKTANAIKETIFKRLGEDYVQKINK